MSNINNKTTLGVKGTAVVLVDRDDNPLGVMEKMYAHEVGALHRAISVVVTDGTSLDGNPRILLQQRAHDKYHAAGMWSNACCSHPFPGERHNIAAARRMQQELNMHLDLSYCGSFVYKASLDNGMVEHELDHVYLGSWCKDLPEPNADEVSALRWLSLNDLITDLEKNPKIYTPWLPQVIAQVVKSYG